MVAPEFNAVQFPFVLAEVDFNTTTETVVQTMLTQTVILGEVNILAADRLFFLGAFPPDGQEATHNYVNLALAQSMFAQVIGYDQEEDILQYLGFTGPRTIVAAGSFTGFVNVVRIAVLETPSNTFNWIAHDNKLLDPLAVKQTYNAIDAFSFTQSITGAEVQDLYQDLSLDDIIDASATTYGRGPSQSVIQDHVTFSIAGATCPLKEYSPHVGSSGNTTYPAVSTTPPTLTTGTLTLTWPRITPTTTLVLKNPEFGNSDVLNFAKIDRQTSGGTRKIFADLTWGVTQAFQLSITNVCETNVTIDQIIQFLNDSLGDEIGLLDWEGRNWKGIILTPETEVTPQQGGHAVAISFEGVLV